MQLESETVLFYLPWLSAAALIALALLALGLILRQLSRVRETLDDERRRLEIAQSERATIDEKLAQALREIERIRAEAQGREHDLSQRIAVLDSGRDEAARKLAALEAANAALTAQLERVPELSAALQASQARGDALASQHAQLETDYAALKTRAAEQLQAANEKIVLLEQAEARLGKEFENLANRIFDDKQRKFSETSKQGVETLLSPVRQQLTDFRKKVEDIYDNENRDRASLRAEINQLKSLNERISGDALNLTKALTGDSKVRGNWGEVQLERVLEQSGLVKGREYEIQGSFRRADGQRFQPDVVIHLPERKDVVIDSKVSLVAYEQYHACDEDSQRQVHIAKHVSSLRNHIKELSDKDYDELVGINSLDLVVMFVPIEPALLLALEHQPGLYEEAFQKRILLVSPTTLMGTLQIIHNIWRYEQQNRNTLQIAAQAGSLYDAFVNFVTSLEKVGSALNKAQEEFNTAHKRLTSGKGNLVSRTQRLTQLGVKAKKTMPEHLLEAADDEDGSAEPHLRLAPESD